MNIPHQNVAHATSCAVAEGLRQQAVAAAIAAGGSSATIAAAIRIGEIAYYRSIVVSAQANGQPHAGFLDTLTRLGGTF